MGVRRPYRTRQKELIVSALRARRQDYLTIQELTEALSEAGEKVGLTTVYRNLDRLEEEGRIAKVSIDGIAGACYRYLPGEDEGVLFCLKCERCGDIVELDCPELARLYAHIADDHGFRVNPGKTLFYGTCPVCAGRADAEKE